MLFEIRSQEINTNDTVPMYRQLEKILLKYITENNLSVGEAIPSESELCIWYKLSRSTVRQAFKLLEDKGIIVRRRGLGSFVAQPKLNRKLDYLYSFSEQLGEMGYHTSSKLISFNEKPLGFELAKLLGLDAKEQVYDIKRLRLADGIPLLLEHTILIKKLCPPLTVQNAVQGSLYAILKEKGVLIGSAIERYHPVLMDKYTQHLLDSEDAPCAFNITRRGYTKHGELFEYTESTMSGKRSCFEITLLPNEIKLDKYPLNT